MSTAAALFERRSRTSCYVDHWMQVTACDLGASARALEAVLHRDFFEEPEAHPWGTAAQARAWVAAILYDDAQDEDRTHTPWIRKVAAFIAAHPQGEFRLYYDT
jgi:hypothetical protein